MARLKMLATISMKPSREDASAKHLAFRGKKGDEVEADTETARYLVKKGYAEEIRVSRETPAEKPADKQPEKPAETTATTGSRGQRSPPA